MSDKLRLGITGSDGNVGTTLRAGLSEDYDLQLNTQNAVDYESTRAAPKAKPKDIPNVM
ncbi:hypothetical protein F7C95_06300 [Opitutia bacterium ISCC 51]|nr:hypothetical protein F7C95_06300 [Opitutae bacterium ISCC 51]QXD29571.1 hypothetical protein GA003_06270 [Opitutae bacterium ISCC 52]